MDNDDYHSILMNKSFHIKNKKIEKFKLKLMSNKMELKRIKVKIKRNKVELKRVKEELKRSKVQITVKNMGIICEGETKETILQILRKQDLKFQSICGGNGLCGKCKIVVLSGEASISEEDKKFFTQEEIMKGNRLACRSYPRSDCEIQWKGIEENNFDVILDYTMESSLQKRDGLSKGYGISIDIGTTTVAIQLIDINSGSVCKSHATMNPQRSYGADVISRIDAANNGNAKEMTQSIRTTLKEGIHRVLEQEDLDFNLLSTIVVSANATMVHLLMGYALKGLGTYPYLPVNLNIIQTSYQELFMEDFISAEVIILPGISTFVGGDIVSGLFQCEFDKKEKPCLLIDLGTNGEMALGDSSGIIVASAAAGTAFEAGNISCGVGSVEGAISSVTIYKDTTTVTTIGNGEPIGVCGTGVIEAIAELLKAGYMDETGLLGDTWFETGFPLATNQQGEIIFISQKDIREVQLAKSAIRAGIEALLKNTKISYDQIDTIYLAGGFGFRLDSEKAIAIGLIPMEFQGNIKAIGNSSLGGAIRYLLHPEEQNRLNTILSLSHELDLGTNKDFQEYFVQYMMFEEEL